MLKSSRYIFPLLLILFALSSCSKPDTAALERSVLSAISDLPLGETTVSVVKDTVAITVDMQAQGELSCVYPRRMALNRLIFIRCLDIPTFPKNKSIKVDYIVDSLFSYSNMHFPAKMLDNHRMSELSPLLLTYNEYLVGGLTVTQYHEVNHLYQILWEDIPTYDLLGPSINQLILNTALQCDGHTVEGNPFERLKGVYGLMDVTPNFPVETKEAFSFFIKNCPLNSTTSL